MRLLFALALLTGPAMADYDADTLERAGVEVSTEGLTALFRKHTPPVVDDARKRRIAALIADLGSRIYQERERATRALATMPYPPNERIAEAARSKDPEVKYRARAIQDHVRTRAPPAELHAAFRLLARKPVPGLIGPLFDVLPGVHAYQRAAHERAVITVATAADRPALEAVLTSERSAATRAIAARALARLGGKAWSDRAAALTKHQDAPLRLAGAQTLAALGDRRALAALVALLEDGDGRTRARAINTLRLLTKLRQNYNAYGDPAPRAKAVAAWRNWLREKGASVALVHPLPSRPPPRNRVLIAIYPKTLIEIDLAKKKVFESKTFRYIWGCFGTPDGHRLACDYSTGEVTEFDASGKQIWKKVIAPKNLQDVMRLSNGNTLVAAGTKAVEFDRSGAVVWSHVAVGSDVTSAQRLENGNTVLCYRRASKVITVAPSGKVVQTLGGLSRPYMARRLQNGNTLVLSWSANTVWEYTPGGKVVWKKDGLSNPASCQRLPNGNTMVSDNKGVHEYSPAGKEVWHYPCGRGRFHRY